jgi:D-sedoheptulose 7-phosphate isomerase
MIVQRIQESIELKKLLLKDHSLISQIERAASLIIQSYRSGNKTIFCGNGGSAADAQHLAAELSGKFYLDRDSIPAEACHTNSSFLTAVSNDYGYERAYSRYVQAVGKPGDILFAISTSGNSENVYLAAKESRQRGMICIALSGASGGKIAEVADILIKVPSNDTPRIQEVHILIGHIICEMVERGLFGPQ